MKEWTNEGRLSLKGRQPWQLLASFWSRLTSSVAASVLPVCLLLCIQYFSHSNTDFECYEATPTLDITADCPVSPCIKMEGSVL